MKSIKTVNFFVSIFTTVCGLLLFVSGANAVCNSPGKCVPQALCQNANGTTLPGSTCPNSGDICCVYQASTACSNVSIQSACDNKTGITEIPDSETAACPSGHNFLGCAKSGNKTVLCCQDPAKGGSMSTCGPSYEVKGFAYNCMPKEACSAMKGIAQAKSNDPVGFANCAQSDEICCQYEKKVETAATSESASTPSAKTYTLTNPLGTADLRVIASRAINTFLGIVGALAMLVFVYAGLSYLIAGSTDRVSKAKDTMKYAIVGIFMIMFAYVLTDTFVSLWTSNITATQSTDPAVPALDDTQAQQEVTTLQEQQQAAQKAEDDAKAQAKANKTDTCGTTQSTGGYSCMTLDSAEQKDYDCKSGYCQSKSESNYICCKKK